MAFVTPYEFTALELVTAALMNGIQDNISEIWKGTTAGDLDYYTSSSAKSRLAIGTAYQFLQTNSGATAPAWGGLHFASVYHNTTQNVNTGTPTALSFNTETYDAQGWHSAGTPSRITVGTTGAYQASTYIEYTAAGGSGGYWDIVFFYVNGAEVMADRRRSEIDANTKKFIVTTPIIQLTATQYVEVYLEQNSGGTRAVQANTRLSLWRVA